MTVGVMIISHDAVGSSLFDAASGMLGMCPLQVELIAVRRGDDPEWLRTQARHALQRLSQGDGVLVLTDMYGSTPSNIVSTLLDSPNVRAIAGLNLPMLVRILNYPRLSLSELVKKAVEGGREGVMTWDFAAEAK